MLFSAFLTIPIYTITGTDFGTLFVLIALYLAITLIECDDKRFVGLYVFSVLILSMAHNASSILFAVFILCLWLLKKFRWLGLCDFPKTGIVLVTVVIVFGWMAFPASFTLGKIADVFVAGISGGATPGGESVPSTFYFF